MIPYRGMGYKVGTPRQAVGVSAATKAANLRRLRRIEGQVRGLQAMVEQDRYCADIIAQVSAVQAALRGVARELMRHHLTHCAAEALAQGDAAADAMTGELLDVIYKHLR